jgi:hypothetical protein
MQQGNCFTSFYPLCIFLYFIKDCVSQFSIGYHHKCNTRALERGVEIKIEINKIYDTQQRVIKRLIFLSLSLLLLPLDENYCDDDKPPKKISLGQPNECVSLIFHGEERKIMRGGRKVIKLIKLFTKICDDSCKGGGRKKLIKYLRK